MRGETVEARGAGWAYPFYPVCLPPSCTCVPPSAISRTCTGRSMWDMEVLSRHWGSGLTPEGTSSVGRGGTPQLATYPFGGRDVARPRWPALRSRAAAPTHSVCFSTGRPRVGTAADPMRWRCFCGGGEACAGRPVPACGPPAPCRPGEGGTPRVAGGRRGPVHCLYGRRERGMGGVGRCRRPDGDPCSSEGCHPHPPLLRGRCCLGALWCLVPATCAETAAALVPARRTWTCP